MNLPRLAQKALQLLCLTLTAIAALPASAETPLPRATMDENIRVAVPHLPPYAIAPERGGAWQGLAVELWQAAANDMDVHYDFIRIAPDSLVSALEAGRVDLALGAFATPEAEARVDFLPAFHVSSLGVAVSQQRTLWSYLRALVSWRFVRIVLSLCALLLLVGALVWRLERGANEDQFGGERRWYEGLGSGFWWAGVTMTTIGYGDKAPVTVGGRAVAMMWMLVALVVTSGLTASLVSVLGSTGAAVEVPSDLRGEAVGALPGTPVADYLEAERVAYEPYESALAGIGAVQRGDLYAFVHPSEALRFLANENSDVEVRVFATSVAQQRVAIALPSGSAFAEPLRRALLRQLTAPTWPRIAERYGVTP